MAHTAANNLKTNPITLEVFDADVTVSATPIKVKCITFTSADAKDAFALQTKSVGDAATGGTVPVVAVHMTMSIAGGFEALNFGDNGQEFESLYFDADNINAGLGALDRVLIYLI